MSSKRRTNSHSIIINVNESNVFLYKVNNTGNENVFICLGNSIFYNNYINYTQKVNIINYTKLLQLMTMDHDVVLERLELKVPVQLGRYFAAGESYRFVSLLPGQL